MMKTEEAKKKMCPFISGIIVRPIDWITNSSSTANVMCRADGCMAWVQQDEERWTEDNKLETVKDCGYCVRVKCGS